MPRKNKVRKKNQVKLNAQKDKCQHPQRSLVSSILSL